MDVSIIIVSYNTVELTLQCIKSIVDKTKDIDYEIIVSDNCSYDNTVEKIKSLYPNVIILKNNKNLGFGAANNKALKKALGKYIFYLNSDTILLNNAVKLFYDYWESSTENLGAIGTKLLNSDMAYTHSGGNFPTYRTSLFYYSKTLLKTFLKNYLGINRKRSIANKYTDEIQYITGADLFLKNDEFAKFDERFFLYFEETDLQYKLVSNGKKIKIIEEPRIIHLEGGSNSKKNEYLKSFSFFESCKSNIIYLQKNLQLTKLKIRFLGNIICLILRINLNGEEKQNRVSEIKKLCNSY